MLCVFPFSSVPQAHVEHNCDMHISHWGEKQLIGTFVNFMGNDPLGTKGRKDIGKSAKRFRGGWEMESSKRIVSLLLQPFDSKKETGLRGFNTNSGQRRFWHEYRKTFLVEFKAEFDRSTVNIQATESAKVWAGWWEIGYRYIPFCELLSCMWTLALGLENNNYMLTKWFWLKATLP